MTTHTFSAGAAGVVIGGAGPAGLSLACAPGDLGLRTEVLEPLAADGGLASPQGRGSLIFLAGRKS